MPQSYLTNESGRFFTQMLMETLNAPSYSYLSVAGISLTEAQINQLISNNRSYLYLTIGQCETWNSAAEIIDAGTANVNQGNTAIIFTTDVSSNVVANDLLTITTQGHPHTSLGTFKVVSVSSSNVIINTAPSASNSSCRVERTRIGYSDTNPPNVATGIANTMYAVWNKMIAGKLLNTSDVAYVVPRYNWTANTIYTKYDPTDEDMLSKKFYVLTSNYDVYKCLDNNSDVASTVEPTFIPSSDWATPQTTSDGYVWKYMFSLDNTDTNFTQKFLTTDYMPVKNLTANSSEPLNQWSVQQAAIDGALENIIMISGGLGYTIPHDGVLTITFAGGGGTGATGTANVSNGAISQINILNQGIDYGTNVSRTFTSVVNSNVLTHSGSSIPTDYIGSSITGNTIPANTYVTGLENGTTPKKVYLSANGTANNTVGGGLISGFPRVVVSNGAGSGAVITSIVANTRVTGTTIVNAGTGYVEPIVITLVSDGSNAVAQITDTDVDINGTILEIDVQERGNGYNNTRVLISGGQGTGASAYVLPGPPGGHGSDPVSELGAKNLMISLALNGSESGNLSSTLGYKYRQAALVLNPNLMGTTNRANAATFMQTQALSVTPGLVAFANNEVIYQNDANSTLIYTATVQSFDSTNNIVYVVDTWRLDAATEGELPSILYPLRGNTSSAYRNFVNNFEDPYLDKYTGKVLYVQNFVPVSRRADQVEYLRIVINP